MGDLNYRLCQHQQLRLTLEDCAVCLINRDDPFLFAKPSAWKNCQETDYDADPETRHLIQVAQAAKHKPKRTNEKMVLSTMAVIKAQAEKIYRQVVPLMNPTVSIQLAEAWLRSHFNYQPHTSVARCDIYSYYVQYCNHISSPPCNHANFGKVVKTVFPRICTRRIGVRGNSKYHYYGIGPKDGDDGPLVLVSIGKRKQCFVYEAREEKTDNKEKLMKTALYQQKSLKATDEDRKELLALLEPAPIVNMGQGFLVQLVDLVKDFLALYRAHSLEILECVLVAHFYEVRDVIVEFWRKLPLQFITSSLMTYPPVMEAIVEYDQLTYQAICKILLPDPIQPTPSGLVQFVKDFIDNLDFWINEGLHLYPKKLREQKLEVCQQFQLLMKRNLQLSWTATAARFVLHNHESVSRLQLVFQQLDVEEILAHCSHYDLDEDTVRQYLGKFQQLLINNCALEEYTDWIETLILDYLHDNECDGTSPEDVAKQLILQWSYVTGQILLQLTLVATPTLGSFHLLDVLFKDYAVYYLHHVLRL